MIPAGGLVEEGIGSWGQAEGAVRGLRRCVTWWLTVRSSFVVEYRERQEGKRWEVGLVMEVEAKLVRTALNVRPKSSGLYL